MESLIPHLIKNPTWMSLSMIFTIFFLFFFLILSLSFAAQADEEKEKGNPNKSKRSLIECIVYCLGTLFFMILPIVLLFQKVSAPSNIIKNKEYTLTKNGKILIVESKNEFLPSTELEIIHEDDARIQVKSNDNLYTIDKQSEEIKEK